MDKVRDEIVDQFYDILEKEGWEPEEEAVGKIVDTSLKNKEGLREMLSRHPKWDDNTMRIIMPVETNGERIDVPEKMDGFRLLCEEIDTDPLSVFETVLARGGLVTSDDCFALKVRGYDGGKAGQKIGRAINAWSITHGINKHKDYNWRFNELINGGRNTTDRTAILSINPVDFLTASHGKFDSCHDINKDNNFCYKSGNLSYAMDGVTMVFFTVGAGETADYPTLRVDRINYHFKSGLLLQGRLYTDTRDNIHAVSRAMVCKVIAECLDVPNLWTRHIKIDQSRITSSGSHYPDYVRTPLGCTMSSLAGATLPENIEIGHVAYCISCGVEHRKENILDCCNTDSSDTLACEGCDGSMHEYDVIWVRDCCYCENCTRYCDECERNHLKDDVRWVSSLRQYMCDSCYDDLYIECATCDKDIKKDDAHDAGGGYYCDECFRKEHTDCEECDEAFKDSELTEVEGRFLCQDCLDAERTEQALCVLAV